MSRDSWLLAHTPEPSLSLHSCPGCRQNRETKDVKAQNRAHPFCNPQRMRTCAGSFPCFSEILTNFGSLSLFLSPRTMGQYAWRAIPFFSQ
jgi:hypothetical protein